MGKIFLLSTSFRPVLGLIKPTILWVMGTLNPGLKTRRRKQWDNIEKQVKAVKPPASRSDGTRGRTKEDGH
jgi:hypothetical protein